MQANQFPARTRTARASAGICISDRDDRRATNKFQLYLSFRLIIVRLARDKAVFHASWIFSDFSTFCPSPVPILAFLLQPN